MITIRCFFLHRYIKIMILFVQSKIINSVTPEVVELAEQLSTPSEKILVYFVGATLSALCSVIAILWFSLKKERDYIRSQDAKNLEVLTKLSFVLENLSEGVKITIPNKMDDIKSSIEKIIR